MYVDSKQGQVVVSSNMIMNFWVSQTISNFVTSCETVRVLELAPLLRTIQLVGLFVCKADPSYNAILRPVKSWVEYGYSRVFRVYIGLQQLIKTRISQFAGSTNGCYLIREISLLRNAGNMLWEEIELYEHYIYEILT